jgi:hypothetical protein
MPFNPHLKLLFVHIPKTGGTSVEDFFDLCHPENFWFDRWDRDHGAFIKQYALLSDSIYLHWEPQHYPLSLLQLLKPEVRNYFKFLFVRNPFTRILSEYFWHTNQVFTEDFQFDPRHFQMWLDDYYNEPHNSHKEPQVTFADDSVDFIGKYEHFETDFHNLLKLLSQRSDVFRNVGEKPIPRLNATGRDKTVLIPRMLPGSRAWIVERFREDFLQFGYDYSL